jgi:hypothetical protein
MVHFDQHFLFEEVQKMRQTWVWLLVAIGSAFAWYVFFQQIVFGRPWGSPSDSDQSVIIVWVLVGILLPIFIGSIKLTTRISQGCIEVKFWPFVKKQINFEEIASFKARDYKPVIEYGGWGVRYAGKKKGWAYNMNGNRGVQMVLKDGKRILIGSRKPEEIVSQLNNLVKIDKYDGKRNRLRGHL